ncbi:MAG: hypothetical protein KGL39_38280 [Patescibacteria group bacterium]|nr:hypothetical protein [Patescibacteria group bacterium]
MLTAKDIPYDFDQWSKPVDAGDGYAVRVQLSYDDTLREPWKEDDGHGPVSDWTQRDKRAGELVLAGDHGQRLYYDFAEAVRVAKRDGWDAPPYGRGSKGERAARAVQRDFDYLRGWCRGEWHWTVVGVRVSRHGEEIETDYCGGIESKGDYWREHAAEVANGIINHDQQSRLASWRGALREARERRYWAQRDVATV